MHLLQLYRHCITVRVFSIHSLHPAISSLVAFVLQECVTFNYLLSCMFRETTPRVLHLGTLVCDIINPRRAAQRGLRQSSCLSVCLCVCVCVCACLLSHISLLEHLFILAVTYSVGNKGQKICGVFSDTASFQSYGTCCIVP